MNNIKINAKNSVCYVKTEKRRKLIETVQQIKQKLSANAYFTLFIFFNEINPRSNFFIILNYR